MTEYLYSISLATQTRTFLLSLGIGFLSGIVYDTVRIIRLSFFKSKISVIISDIFFCLFTGILSFIFLITVNEGELRFYLLVGEILGFFVYYFSLGVVIFRFSQVIICFMKRLFKKIFSIIFKPIFSIYGKIKGICKKKTKKCKKIMEKGKNKSKIHLKINKQMLYNLFVNKRNSDKNSVKSKKGV